MSNYRVTFYYNTYIDVEVEADAKVDAISKASEIVSNKNNLDELFDNLTELDETDVVKIKD